MVWEKLHSQEEWELAELSQSLSWNDAKTRRRLYDILGVLEGCGAQVLRRREGKKTFYRLNR
jgi:hypothetical protein